MMYPQLFIRLGKDRYAPVPDMIPNEVMYQWDEGQQRILPVKTEIPSDTEIRPSTGFSLRSIPCTAEYLNH